MNKRNKETIKIRKFVGWDKFFRMNIMNKCENNKILIQLT
jgi:hypothetical protein